ncbi:MAG: hypothetical protein H6704_10105 [Myxococcales bacterium]|nr:hypothetical protein [Myxococcales bacterium]MCB9536597.1 hypothetical protein [Myxococcales bacterium]
MHGFRRILAVGALALTLPLAARAQCPPTPDFFDIWTWSPSSQTGDDWITADVCSSGARRQSITNRVITHMGLDENWDYWDDGFLSSTNVCNPDRWGARVVNGAYATDMPGEARDNDTLNHTATPGATLPNNIPVVLWLSQYVSFYVSEEGHRWQCHDDDDPPGPPRFTFASNPNSNSAITLYFPWFWNKSAFDRGSTLVHEATHEFQGHIADSACSNGGSCDTAWLQDNAQSFQIVFDAQAVDAYQKDADDDLIAVNFGSDACGYLPLLPDQDRFSLVQVMRNKLMNVFQIVPPTSQYPASAIIDNLPGTVWAPGAAQGGNAGDAYRIDVVNSARWSCGAVCDPADFTWPNGSRACNEDFQPENEGINQMNRQRCQNLNAQVAAGVTPAEYQTLKTLAYGMFICKQGVSQQYLDGVCDDVTAGRIGHIDDIADRWPLIDDGGYGYSAEDAIERCQIRWCSGRYVPAWDDAARDVCYEYDDPAGCMPLLCGDLAELDPDPGRDSIEYFEAVVCRASELGRDIPGVRPIESVCDKVFNECIIETEYFPAWLEQLDGEDCWSDALPQPVVGRDPLHTELRRQMTVLTAERFQVVDRTAGLLTSECAMREAECEALQAALQAAHAKILGIRAVSRIPWERPPGPDPWDRRFQRLGYFDRDFERAMVELGQDLLSNGVEGRLFEDERIQRAAAMPEARVALAELVGYDTYLQSGGRFFAEGVIAPERMQQFSGPDAMADPHGLSLEGMEAEFAALRMLSDRMEDPAWQALMSRAGELDGITYHGHVNAMLGAPDAQALWQASEALRADLEALARR